MLFNWNADTIRWYIDANDYSGFYKNIARTVAPELAGYKSLCDVGCGLGLFDFEVAHMFESITCADINETALRSIDERSSRLGLRNIKTRLGDGYELTGSWDVVYMSFFGSRELDVFLPLCKKLIAVVSVSADSELFPMKQPRYKKNTVAETEKYLAGKNIGYKLIQGTFAFGQPFVSREDARRCVRSYVPDITVQELEDYLDKRLKETLGEVYPYYLPREKTVGMFILEGMLR